MTVESCPKCVEVVWQLKETNQTLDFFCDFEKISQNVEDIKLSLCMLNSLIGQDGYAAKLEYPLQMDSLEHAADRFAYIYEKYLAGKEMNIYLSCSVLFV